METSISITVDGLFINCPLISLYIESNVKLLILWLFMVDLRHLFNCQEAYFS